MKPKIELMDWKDLERGSMNQLRDAKKQELIATLLFDAATKQIKKLGGKTIAEEDAEAKKSRDETTSTA